MGTADGSVTILKPCVACGVPLIYRSQWESMSRAKRKASGCRVHAGRGLCGNCYMARLRADRGVDRVEPLDLDFSHITPTLDDALTGGHWRLDPFRRVQVYVLDPVADKTICPGCGGSKKAASVMCRPCRNAASRNTERTCVDCGFAVVIKAVYDELDEEQRAGVRVFSGKGLCRACYSRRRYAKSVAS